MKQLSFSFMDTPATQAPEDANALPGQKCFNEEFFISLFAIEEAVIPKGSNNHPSNGDKSRP